MRGALQLLGLQGLVGAGVAGLLAVSGAPASTFLLCPVLACLLGAWAWARRAGPLERDHVRAVASRQGLLVGPLVGLAWAAVAAQPGQVEVPDAGFWLVAGVLSIAAGATGAALTLCGLDLGRAAG